MTQNYHANAKTHRVLLHALLHHEEVVGAEAVHGVVEGVAQAREAPRAPLAPLLHPEPDPRGSTGIVVVGAGGGWWRSGG